ncbi:MAG: tetratricopeptide repeat protein, partial [Verrucomicrobia bacterium]|nr:tetratricopeptide repeat protein [Verrucomicrobiota bacterium]
EFEKAHALDMARPEGERMLSATFYFWYASALERTGDLERADEFFEQCISMDDKYSEAYNYVAYMWAEKGEKLDKALEYVTKALEIEPESAAYIDTLGWIYFMQEDYDRAFAEIRRAAEIMPEDPTITEHMGDVLMKLGEESEALSWWQTSIRLNPENKALADKLREHDVNVEALLQEAPPVDQLVAPTNPPPADPTPEN